MRITLVSKRFPPKFYPVSIKGNETTGIGRHVRNVTKPFVPDHTSPKELTGGFGEYADYKRASVIAEERRRAWARLHNISSIYFDEVLLGLDMILASKLWIYFQRIKNTNMNLMLKYNAGNLFRD